ncbi:acetyl-CoA hydrolase/transferase C-terminal domain-containing protein [Deinococcus koreensis]|uniref:acetyl-CoA hydrolase/transferase C-terminal domain-containing protein n=1 Tax=Deinococcus koreensis TaxID=2054903 RepID=UPI001A9EE6EB|nr:acetyl-CoA hydrolase/transferase C-terminal domain-containing protein [Deinococcus koreensis]
MTTMRTLDVTGLTSLLTGRAWPAEPRVVVSGNLAVPWTLLAALDSALPRYRLHALNAPAGLPRREGVSYETTFVGPGMRHEARLSYVPARLSLVPLLLGGALVPDLVLVQTSAPRQGRLSLGIEVNVLPAAIKACRARGGLVLAQANAQMPYTFGDGEYDAGVFDGVLEVDEPLPDVAARPGAASGADAAAQIGALVAARVPDGATLQLGIGEVSDATLPGLAQRRRLALWSEMFSDGVLRLEEAGALDPARPIISSFAFGSQELYAWMNANPRIVMRRTEVTNSPSEISRQPLMTSINTALQVDLFAQANASRIGARIHSGFGGQTDFIVGALHAPGGQALMALRSWHPRAQVSTIVPA